MKFKNLTGSEITVGGTTFPSEGEVTVETEVRNIDRINGIRIARKVVKGNTLPQTKMGVILIVPEEVRLNSPRTDLMSVDGDRLISNLGKQAKINTSYPLSGGMHRLLAEIDDMNKISIARYSYALGVAEGLAGKRHKYELD
jgi:hypothetical protein